MLLHTNLGSQYTSQEFTQYVQSHGILHSLSRKGYSYDNARIESLHVNLKKEEVYHHVQYIDYRFTKLALFQFI
ncbi:hypothetical protein B4109_3111 [Geobacillus stearothermophilus]|uniref:Integrase catalytic domain-containing protein n=1 Tax=Geobacillus stearothermophilus TaxID=1422 RepID=A0A150MT00_GEOSE|nr:hypothetical protein B4109_3111 [Geobacillus stearothermophilus]